MTGNCDQVPLNIVVTLLGRKLLESQPSLGTFAGMLSLLSASCYSLLGLELDSQHEQQCRGCAAGLRRIALAPPDKHRIR